MTAVCNESAISGQALRDRCGAPKTTSAKKFSLSIPTEEQMTAWAFSWSYALRPTVSHGPSLESENTLMEQLMAPYLRGICFQLQ